MNERPLTVALVGHKSLPANYGGVEVSAEEIGARLAAAGHHVHSFTSSEVPQDGEYRGIRCHRVGRVDGKHLGALTQALTATIAACRRRPDVVHFQAMGPSVFAPIVRLLTRAIVVVTIAGRDDRRRKWGFVARQLMRLSYFTSTRVCHGVICVSQALVEELAPVTRGAIRYVPNGVPSDPPDDDAEETHDQERPFVLFAARLVPEKRLQDLVAAHRVLDLDLDLVIAGGSSGAPQYEESVRALAADDPRIRFVGHQPPDAVRRLMRRATVFVLPSELEGLPIALLEATSRGTPVVVSNLPCHREILGEGGPGARLAVVGDASSLAAAIRDVATDPEARVDAARRAIEIRRTYDWDCVAAHTYRFYDELLRSVPRRVVRRHSSVPLAASGPDDRTLRVPGSTT